MWQILTKVQKELLGLLEKDTLPRFKQSRLFVEYLENDPSVVAMQTSSGKRGAKVAAAV